jgi:adenylyltransferase/sulfurtransferase
MNSSRYIRQTSLKGFGPEAQAKLKASRVVVVGLGGLGIPVVQYLNAMGIGTLGLVEQDVVELTNLQRQVLYTEKDLERPKLELALEYLKQRNSGTNIHTYDSFLNRQNALDIIESYDLVIDATDNFATRYLINDSCVILHKPFVYGALHGFEGQVSVFNYDGGPTYRCLFPEMPALHEIPDCNTNGVLGVLPGIVGTLQALEAVKILTGTGEILSGRLMLYNGLDQSVQKINFPLNPKNLNISKLRDYYGEPGCYFGNEIGGTDFARLLERNNPPFIIDVRDPGEFEKLSLPGSINIPLPELKSRQDILESLKTVYVICASGKRSRAAQQWIKENYPHLTAFSVEGGIQNFRSLCP